MRSEGFPFIVGVWGWTCVRFVLLPRRRVVVASSSCRRRLVVANSLIHCHWAVHSHWRHHPVFQSMKSGGSLARNARFGVPKSQNVRSFSCFAWQAQFFGSVSMQACRFFRGRRSTLWCGLSRCRGRRSILWRGEGSKWAVCWGLSTNQFKFMVNVLYFNKMETTNPNVHTFK